MNTPIKVAESTTREAVVADEEINQMIRERLIQQGDLAKGTEINIQRIAWSGTTGQVNGVRFRWMVK